MSDFKKKSSIEVFFQGSAGRVHCRYYQGTDRNCPAVICLPPDPKQGATMDNKIISNLANTFYDAGFTVLKINYHGVGKSEGTLGNEKDQIKDISLALDWLKLQNASISHFWMCGYSFGSWMAVNVINRRPEIENFVLVSPLTDKFDYKVLSPCPAHGLLVYPEKDELTSFESVLKFQSFLNEENDNVAEITVTEGANHIFDGKIESLNDTVMNYVNTTIAMRVTKLVRKKRRKRKKKDSII